MRLLSKGLEDLIAEDQAVLRTGLETARWVSDDDTSARHNGRDGVVTQLGLCHITVAPMSRSARRSVNAAPTGGKAAPSSIAPLADILRILTGALSAPASMVADNGRLVRGARAPWALDPAPAPGASSLGDWAIHACSHSPIQHAIVARVRRSSDLSRVCAFPASCEQSCDFGLKDDQSARPLTLWPLWHPIHRLSGRQIIRSSWEAWNRADMNTRFPDDDAPAPGDDPNLVIFVDVMIARFGWRAMDIAEHQAALAQDERPAMRIRWNTIAALIKARQAD